MKKNFGKGHSPSPNKSPIWEGDTAPKPNLLGAYGASTLAPSALDLPPVP